MRSVTYLYFYVRANLMKCFKYASFVSVKTVLPVSPYMLKITAMQNQIRNLFLSLAENGLK
ncbi:hypothetical protein HYN48_04705 [Flavobacterium magnum]|uniref:Uncharacterized protein n=1 Tax=Flavobacterium magnum TaxID=2162713 RepID=A0A2S0REA4_9FLAO|nr:hypothetical protein HYN48_04705 [Flavobacterium magnum]